MTREQIQINLLLEFDRVCRTLKVPYSLAYGTALGAVRHKGFIPWDDDIDVMLLRSDFEKIVQAFGDKESRYFLQTCESENQYPYPFAKLRNSETTCIEQGNEKLNINHGIFIDIFPLDFIPANSIKYLIQLMKAQTCWILSRKYTYPCTFKGFIGKVICSLLSDELRIKAIKFIQHSMSKFPSNKSKGIADLNYGIAYAKCLYPLDTMANTEKVLFEKNKFSLTHRYHEFLELQYGNYKEWPPENQRIGQHNFVVCDPINSYRNRKI